MHARIAVRMNTTNSCPTARQAGLALGLSALGGANVFGPALTFSTLMRDEAKNIARGLQQRDPDLLDRLIEQHQLAFWIIGCVLIILLTVPADIRPTSPSRARRTAAKVQIRNFIAALDSYRNDTGEFPSTEQSLDALTDPELEKPLQIPSENEPSPLHQVLAQEREEDVQASLEKIPAIYREVLVLRFQEELQIEEMAGVLSIPVSTVKSRLYRGLDALRGALEGGWA